MLKKIFYTLFGLFLLILVGRSIQYVYRTYIEFRFPEPDKISAIDVCQLNPTFTNIEAEYLYKYLQIGKICKKP